MTSLEGDTSTKREAVNESEICAQRNLSALCAESGEGVSVSGSGSCLPAEEQHAVDVLNLDELGYEGDCKPDATSNSEADSRFVRHGVDESGEEVQAVPAEVSLPPNLSGQSLFVADSDAVRATAGVLASGNAPGNEGEDGMGTEDLQRGSVGDTEVDIPQKLSEPISPTAVEPLDTTEVWKDVVVLDIPSIAPSGQCKVYIVGTAHVSVESCREVANVIETVQPEIVFIELCPSRVAMLMPQTLQVPTIGEMLESWRSKKMNALGIIYGWFLSKVSAKLEVFPGSEFRVAYEGAMACGAKVTLGDRPVQVTLRRTWAKMSLWEKTVLIYCMVFRSLFLPSAEELSEMVEGMKDNDMVTRVIQEMGKKLPTVMETLIFERDLYMTAMLRHAAKDYSRVVAVVGKGHVPGITQNWDKTISIESLMVIPNKKSTPGRLWGLLAVAVGSLAIASGIYCSRRK